MTPQNPSPAFDRTAIDALSRIPIPRSAKGFGGIKGGDSSTAEAIASDRSSIFEGTFTFPLLTIRETAVAHNIAQLARFCSDRGLELAPHGKTTMAPQLFADQLAAGAWGLTVATIGQAQICRDFGVRRLLLANQLVDPAGIAWLAEELRRDAEFELYCYVDSLDGVRLLHDALTTNDAGRLLPVLVELGYPGGRTGCRRVEDARDVARAAEASGTLRVAGVAGYEGGMAHDRSPESCQAVHAFCQELVDLAWQLQADGWVSGRPLVTAGGSAYPDLVADALGSATDRATVVLRSGCYLTHDDGEYARISPFTEQCGSPYALTAALELWAHVLSRPEPGLALLGAGRRDVGFDQGFPIPRRHRAGDGTLHQADAMRVTQLNDQHAYLGIPETSELRVGDLVSLGVSHPCTTLDRWRHIVQVDDDDLATDVVLTFF